MEESINLNNRIYGSVGHRAHYIFKLEKRAIDESYNILETRTNWDKSYRTINFKYKGAKFVLVVESNIFTQ